LGSDKVFFHFFKDFFERAPAVVCHAPPCFLSFYRVPQRLPRKKLKNFLRARRGSGCAKISSAVQRKVDRALFMKYAKRCRLRAILAPLRGLFFSIDC
jgi:hypothetical protein